MITQLVTCLLIVFVIIFSLLLYILTNNLNYWKIRKVPHEKPIIFFGNFYKISTKQQHIGKRIREIYNKFDSSYIGVLAFNKPYLLIKSPQLIKSILVRNFSKFCDRSLCTDEKSDKLSYDSLFATRNPNWRALRNRMSPIFTSGKLRLMFPLMQDVIKTLDEYLSKRNNETIEFKEVMSRFSLDVICSCSFGIDSDCLKNENSYMFKMGKECLDVKKFRRSLDMFCIFFCPALIPILKPKVIDEKSAKYFTDIFYETLRQREEKGIKRTDLVDMMKNLKDDSFGDGYNFDEVKMVSQAIMFFYAGTETTTAALTFAIYELAVNQSIQENLRYEIDKTLENFDGNISYEAVQEMEYLDMIICETLRKYPFTSYLDRITVEDFKIEETGFVIEKGTPILIPVAGLHFDSKYYKDPEEFDPERFRGDNKIKYERALTYLPFGDGPRFCIADRFAMLTMRIALVSIFKKYEIQKTSSTPIPLVLDPASVFVEPTSGIFLKVVDISQ